MADEQSVAPQQEETPATNDVLEILSDTEDDSDESVEKVESTDRSEEVEETDEEEAEPEAEGEQPPEQEEDSEDESEDDSEEESVDPKEEARRRYEERQKAIQERRQRIQEQNKEYLDKAEDEYDKRLRTMEVQRYSEIVENNENTLIGEFERAKANPDLQIFNPDNKEQFNQRAYDKVMRDYNAGYIQYDQSGNMIEIKGSLLQHLTETAELLKGATRSGAVQQVKATRKVKQSADTKPAAQPKEPTKDPILDILSSD
jgi:hypothetical protein